MSAQPGIFFLEKGSMTRAHIWGATVFEDYDKHWVKVHIIQDISGDYTLKAKEYFERDCMIRNVLPKHYHVDNGRFAVNTFKQDSESKMQHLTFCGVGAHQQNGVYELIIKDLIFSSWILVFQAQLYCPGNINIMLLTIYLVASTERMNNFHVEINVKTAKTKISDTIG